MPVVRLGHSDGNVTTAEVPDSYTVREQFAAITADDGVWANHTEKDPDRQPTWVASSNPDLQSKLARYYDCDGEPEAIQPQPAAVEGVDQS